MKTRREQEIKFVVCIVISEPDLEMRKIYRVVPDESAKREGYFRVIDESGEDYLYPSNYFVPVEMNKEAEQALMLASA